MSVLPTSQPLERQPLFEQVASQIEDQVLGGDLAAGARLAAEGALAAQFGVSRPVVREALARLRERGLIETVNGSGTYIRHPQPDNLAEVVLRHLRFAASGTQAIASLYDARIAIEVMTARLAAERASDDDRVQIHDRLTAMRGKRTTQAAWTAADLGFHLAIATAAHSPFLPTLLSPLHQTIERAIRESYRDPAAVRSGLRAHERIWETIESREPQAAADAMRAHLEDSQRRLVRALAADDPVPAER